MFGCPAQCAHCCESSKWQPMEKQPLEKELEWNRDRDCESGGCHCILWFFDFSSTLSMAARSLKHYYLLIRMAVLRCSPTTICCLLKFNEVKETGNLRICHFSAAATKNGEFENNHQLPVPRNPFGGEFNFSVNNSSARADCADTFSLPNWRLTVSWWFMKRETNERHSLRLESTNFIYW